MLISEWNELRLEVISGGQLLPWLGPALRGTVGMALKNSVCRVPRAKRGTFCGMCSHMIGCAYGETFEREVPRGSADFRPQEGTPRPLVLCPYFPVAEAAQPGMEVPIRVVLVGGEAARHGPALLRVIAQCGEDAGFGHDRVRYRLRTDSARVSEHTLTGRDLPATPGAISGVIPRLGVGLTAPLFLREESPALDEGARDGVRARGDVQRPEFVDLFRAALRSVGRLFGIYDEQLEADFAALKREAVHVRMVDHCYEPFRQRKWSSRGESRYLLKGCVGGGVYADVPLSLLPWMLWGGRLHVGGHRVAGAGGWRLVLD